MINHLIAERERPSTWWRTPAGPEFPEDPNAYQHRQELLAALIGTSSPPRPPRAWKPSRLKTDELIDEVQHLAGTASAREIAARLGMSAQSVARRLSRAGRPELARTFWAAHKQDRRAA